MVEEQKEIHGVNWKKACGCLEIMRTFRMAVHPAKLVLCLVGLGAMLGIGVVLDQVPGFGHEDGDYTFCENAKQLLDTLVVADMAPDAEVFGREGKVAQWAWGPVRAATDGIGLAIDYWQTKFLFALVYSVICLAIWALIGGAVTRMAAVQVAREENIPLKEAMCFAVRKWPSLVTSPLIPFAVLVAIALIISLSSLFIMIPYVGEIVGSVVFILAMIAGVILALIFIGGAFSVGLQWPTIGAEGSDSFDAISRSISYISSRPWRYVFYTAFSAVYACLTFVFVHFVVYLALRITHAAAALGTWGTTDADSVEWADKINRIWAVPEMGTLWQWPLEVMARGSEAVAATIIGIWAWLLIGVMVAFLVSFCFSSQTVIYFLLRRLVDSTDIDEVYMEEGEEEENEVELAVEETAEEESTEEEPPAEEKKKE